MEDLNCRCYFFRVYPAQGLPGSAILVWSGKMVWRIKWPHKEAWLYIDSQHRKMAWTDLCWSNWWSFWAKHAGPLFNRHFLQAIFCHTLSREQYVIVGMGPLWGGSLVEAHCQSLWWCEDLIHVITTSPTPRRSTLVHSQKGSLIIVASKSWQLRKNCLRNAYH